MNTIQVELGLRKLGGADLLITFSEHRLVSLVTILTLKMAFYRLNGYFIV